MCEENLQKASRSFRTAMIVCDYPRYEATALNTSPISLQKIHPGTANTFLQGDADPKPIGAHSLSQSRAQILNVSDLFSSRESWFGSDSCDLTVGVDFVPNAVSFHLPSSVYPNIQEQIHAYTLHTYMHGQFSRHRSSQSHHGLELTYNRQRFIVVLL